MFDRLLRRWSIDLRIFSIYLAVGLGLVSLVFGAIDTLNTVLNIVRQSSGALVVAQILEKLPSRLSLFTPIALVLFALGLVWAYLVGKSFKQQIKELRNGVEGLILGETGISIPEGNLDEISLLSNFVNQLATQLEKERLDQKALVTGNSQLIAVRNTQLRVVGELARETANTRNLEILLNRSVNLIKSRLNYYYVSVYLVDEERRHIQIMAGTGEAGSYHVKRKKALRVGEVNILSGVVNSGAPRLLNDVSTDFIFQRDSLLPNTRSEAVLPLRAGKEVLGVLDIHSESEGAFSPEDIPILQILADQLALAVQNARLVRNLQRSVREANSIYQRYTQRVWSHERIGDRPNGYQYDSIQIMPVDNQLPAPILEKLSKGYPVPVLPQELGSSSSESDGSILLAPVMMYNQLVGVIGIEQDSAGYEWTEEVKSLIAAITSQVSLTLDNARLLEEAQLRSMQLRILQEITAVAASHTNLIELLDHVSQKMRASFDLLHCGMFLIEPDGKALSLVASASSDPFLPGANLLGVRLSLEDQPILTGLFEKQASQVVYNISEEPASSIRDFMLLRNVKLAAFVPLQSMNTVIGVASLEVGDESRKFTEEDISLLDQISLQISSAIDVARSFEHESRRTERERKVGEVSSRMRESLDIDAVMRTAIQDIQRAFAFTQVEVRIDGRNAKEEMDSEKASGQGGVPSVNPLGETMLQNDSDQSEEDKKQTAPLPESDSQPPVSSQESNGTVNVERENGNS